MASPSVVEAIRRVNRQGANGLTLEDRTLEEDRQEVIRDVEAGNRAADVAALLHIISELGLLPEDSNELDNLELKLLDVIVQIERHGAMHSVLKST